MSTGAGSTKSSGSVIVKTPDAGTLGVSGHMSFSTGTTSSGASGEIKLATGHAAAGSSGGVILSGGIHMTSGISALATGGCCVIEQWNRHSNI